jgi:hypothetical protein
MAQNDETYNRYGKIFLTQGRPEFGKTCVTFCIVTYKRYISNNKFSEKFVKQSSPFLKGQDAA